MRELIGELDMSQFRKQFSSEEKCLEYLSVLKWQDGFKCRKCGHTNFCKGKTPFARRCTRCKKEESATAHTIFHRCKIGLTEAFELAFSVCNEPDISTYELARKLERRQMTCWKFKKKIIDCIENKGELRLYEYLPETPSSDN